MSDQPDIWEPDEDAAYQRKMEDYTCKLMPHIEAIAAIVGSQSKITVICRPATPDLRPHLLLTDDDLTIVRQVIELNTAPNDFINDITPVGRLN